MLMAALENLPEPLRSPGRSMKGNWKEAVKDESCAECRAFDWLVEDTDNNVGMWSLWGPIQRYGVTLGSMSVGREAWALGLV